MLDKDGPDSLKRKPLGRGILGEPASVRSRPHPAGPIGYSNLMAKAFENESNAAIKRKKLSLTRKTGPGGQSTSYQKEAVNFAIRSTPPKLKVFEFVVCDVKLLLLRVQVSGRGGGGILPP